MPAREVAGRAALLAGGVAASLLLLEVVLQVGAFFVRATGSELASTWVTGNLRVLCLGDSNTFGLHLRGIRETHSYPAQLESLWNGSGGQPPLEVLNFGIPGMNSSAIRRDLPDLLRRLVPDFVILMVGANDTWTEPAELDPSRDRDDAVLRWLVRNSRVHRLYSLLRRRLDPLEMTVELQHASRTPRRGKGDGPPPEGGERKERRPPTLLANLEAVAHATTEAGARLLLMTYPTDVKVYGFANRSIRRVAIRSDTPLIDLRAAFRPLCPRTACRDLLFRDGHPNARGYALVAETIVAYLRQSGLEAAEKVSGQHAGS